MKAKINYKENEDYILVQITDPDRNLLDIENTAQIVVKLQNQTNSLKVFYDHSKFKWKFDYLQEYSLAKNINKFLPYREDTKVAFYLGDFYDKNYWELMKKIIDEHSDLNIEYFGDYYKAIDWLLK
jgi:hypothetical protein